MHLEVIFINLHLALMHINIDKESKLLAHSLPASHLREWADVGDT